MKNIELNKKQKKNLLEMFKKLFPEHSVDDDLYIDDNGMINYLIETKKNCYDCVEIHWFEFCMTHLFYALYDNWRREGINCVTDFHLDIHNYYLNDFVDNKEIHKNYEKCHPINYLYNKFKELRKLGYEF